MKNEEWTQQKLEDLITVGAEENIHLEFKDGRSLRTQDKEKQEICKDISAFANSDGGRIVYGMSEINHKVTAFAPVDGSIITKEWLENVISTGIQQRIDEISIHPVRLNNDLSTTVYIVDIPVSFRSPHMANGRYYKRYNFQSLPMEEYEVRQLYGKKQRIILENDQVNIRLLNTATWENDIFFTFEVTYHLKNIGNSVVEHYRIRCELDKFAELKYDFPKANNYMLYLKGNRVFVSPKTSLLIFPDEDINAFQFSFKVDKDKLLLLDDLSFKATLFTEYGNYPFEHLVGKSAKDLIMIVQSQRETSKNP